MSIVRVNKRKNPYVVMDKTGLEDENLSFKAKGLLAYLLSKPDNWTARINHLKKVSKDGRDSVRTGLKELEEHGYLTRKPIRDEKGQIKEWESVIREIPTSSPETDFPTLDNPTLDNPTLIINDCNNYRTNNTIEEEESEESGKENSGPSQELQLKYQQVFNKKLSQKMYDKLIALYPDEDILIKALEISEEKGDKPAYILKMLADWKKHGISTIEQINSYIAKREKKNSSRSKGRRSRNNISNEKESNNKQSVAELEANGWT